MAKTSKRESGKAAGSAIKQTRQRKRQRGRQQRRQRWITVVLAVVGGIILVGALFIFGNQPATGGIPPEALERYGEIPQGRSEEGFPTLGAEASAVTLKLFTSFDCGRCAAQGELLNDLLQRFTTDSEISLQFIPIVAPRMLEFQNAEFATKFALCSGRNGRFWEYQEALYSWQQYEQRAYASARLANGIENLGLDRSEVEACVRGSLVEQTIDTALAAAEAQLGFNQYGFPLFAVNLEPITPATPGDLPTLEQIQNALDAALTALEEGEEEVTVPEDTADEAAPAETTPTMIPATEVPAIPVPGVAATATLPPTEAIGDDGGE